MSSPHVWIPPEDVVRAGEAVTGITYRWGDDLPEGVQRPVTPATDAFRDWIVANVKGVPAVGTVRPSNRRTGGRDPHLNGYAADIMIRNSDPVVGDAVANWLVAHAKALGLQYVLWSRTEWTAKGSRGRWGVGTYGGTNPHTDHVHVELGVEARAVSRETMTARLNAARTDSWLALAVPFVTLAAVAAFVFGFGQAGA